MDIFIYISDLSNFGIFAKFMRNILRPSYAQNSCKYLSVILEIFKISTAKKNVCNDGIFVLVVTFLTHSPLPLQHSLPAEMPKGSTTRWLTYVWAGISLLVVSCYTANLASVMTGRLTYLDIDIYAVSRLPPSSFLEIEKKRERPNSLPYLRLKRLENHFFYNWRQQKLLKD